MLENVMLPEEVSVWLAISVIVTLNVTVPALFPTLLDVGSTVMEPPAAFLIKVPVPEAAVPRAEVPLTVIVLDCWVEPVLSFV